MKNTLIHIAVLGALFGSQSVMAEMLPEQEQPCINLGVAPYGDASKMEALRKLGLTADQIKQTVQQKPKRIMMNNYFPIADMIMAGGKIIHDKRVCGEEQADLYILHDEEGKEVYLIRPDKCGNWLTLDRRVTLRFRTPVAAPKPPVAQVVPPPEVETPSEEPVTATPPVVQPVPTPQVSVPEVPIEQVEKKPAGVELEAYGQYKKTLSPTSYNEGGYGEVVVWQGNKGIGILGSTSDGHSLSTKSAWNIDLIGVELGFKGGNDFKTEDGRLEKRLWQIKPRLGVEHEKTIDSKGRPDRNQRTILAGAYVENLKTDGQCLYGWVGGFWVPIAAKVNAGKEAEDRTSAYVHYRRECKIDEKWSWRRDVGPGWSAVSGVAFDVAGQLRYRTDNDITFFFGPQVGWSFDKGAPFWAGFVGAQLNDVDIGILQNKYVDDNKVTPTGQTGAEVFAPAVIAPLPTVKTSAAQVVTPAPIAAVPTAQPTSPQSDEEMRQMLETWWAGQPKK